MPADYVQSFLADKHLNLTDVALDSGRADKRTGQKTLSAAVTEALAGAPKATDGVNADKPIRNWLASELDGRAVAKSALQDAYRAARRAFTRRGGPTLVAVAQDGSLDAVFDEALDTDKAKAKAREEAKAAKGPRPPAKKRGASK